MGSQRNSKVGRAIFKESFNALKQDIQVLAIPFLAFLATLVVGVFIVVSWVLLTPVMEIYKASNVVQTAMGIVAGFIGANIHVVSQAAVMAAAMVQGWLMYPVAKWYCPACVSACQPTPAHQASVAARARILGEWR